MAYSCGWTACSLPFQVNAQAHNKVKHNENHINPGKYCKKNYLFIADDGEYDSFIQP